MNVYECWYLGIRGYCCRTPHSKWMFVPELGQMNNTIYKHLSIHDFVFNNAIAQEYELSIEKSLSKLRTNPLLLLRSLLFPTRKMRSVGGMLFTTS